MRSSSLLAVAAPERWIVHHEAYHAEDGLIGSTMVKNFSEHGPGWYERVYVRHTQPKPAPTEEMQFGTAVHYAILQPDLFGEHVCREPDEMNLRKPADRQKLADWREAHRGFVCLKPALYDQIEPMVQATLACGTISDIIKNSDRSEVECGLRWESGDVPLPCKALLDLVVLSAGGCTIYDLKTNADPRPEPFAKAALNRGYHISAAHYTEGAMAVLGTDRVSFRWIVVDKRPPYREPRIYQLPKEEHDLGRRSRHDTLTRIKACYDYDDWLPEGYGTIQRLQFPKWAWTQ